LNQCSLEDSRRGYRKSTIAHERRGKKPAGDLANSPRTCLCIHKSKRNIQKGKRESRLRHWKECGNPTGRTAQDPRKMCGRSGGIYQREKRWAQKARRRKKKNGSPRPSEKRGAPFPGGDELGSQSKKSRTHLG